MVEGKKRMVKWNIYVGKRLMLGRKIHSQFSPKGKGGGNITNLQNIYPFPAESDRFHSIHAPGICYQVKHH